MKSRVEETWTLESVRESNHWFCLQILSDLKLTQRTCRRTAPCLFCSRVKMSSGKSPTPEKTAPASKILHLIPLAGALKPAVVFVERIKPPDELFKLPNTGKNWTASLLGDGVTMAPSGNQICTNHWWEAPNQEVILRGQTTLKSSRCTQHPTTNSAVSFLATGSPQRPVFNSRDVRVWRNKE